MAITVQEVQQGASSASLADVSCTAFTGNPASGDAIVVAVTSFDSVTSRGFPSAPTDTAGNTYVQMGATQQSSDNRQKISLWIAQNITGGSSFVVTAHVTANTNYTTVIAYWLKGAATTGADNGDAKSNYQSATNAPTTGTTTVSPASNSLAIAAVTTTGADNIIADGSGWTRPTNGAQTNDSTLQDLYTEYKAVSATYSGDWTTTSGTVNATSITASIAPGGAPAASVKNLALLGVG